MTIISTQTPLQEIERSVQLIAHENDIDVTIVSNRPRLVGIINQEIDLWQQRNSHRPLTDDSKRHISGRIESNIVGYGPIDSLLADDSVWEIMINAHDSIFIRRHGRGTTFHHESFHDPEHLRRTIARILSENGLNQRKLEPADGLQDVQLAQGARLHIVHPDLTKEGSLIVNIRKFTGLPIRNISELIKRQMLSASAARFLLKAQEARSTIIFAGPPGSGKTTLLGTLVGELPPETRVTIAEEVLETLVELPNVAHLQSRPTRSDRNGIDLRTLVTGFLRMSPDFAIVGEVRDKEALPLILTLSSGVPGYTTIHATSARAALSRLRLLIQIGGFQMPFSAVTQMVSDAVDLVVYANRIDGVPKVTEIVAVEDPNGGVDSNSFTTSTIFELVDNKLVPSGLLPQRLRQKSRNKGIDITMEELLND